MQIIIFENKMNEACNWFVVKQCYNEIWNGDSALLKNSKMWWIVTVLVVFLNDNKQLSFTFCERKVLLRSVVTHYTYRTVTVQCCRVTIIYPSCQSII